MLFRKILLLSIFSPFALNAFSQTYTDDLLRYSNTTFGGTARTQSIAGAQTALGGDIGSLSSNPAGLGFFRKSDFALTPDFSNSFTKTNYLDNHYSNAKNDLDFSNVGVVWAKSTPQADEGAKSSGWLSYGFGMGYNRTANFNSNFSFHGLNKVNSFTNYLADRANSGGSEAPVADQSGSITDNNLAGQAYNGYLINPVSTNTSGVVTYAGTTTPNAQNPVNQTGSNYQEGSISNFNLSFGTNYGNQLYLGIGADIATLRYAYSYTFNESGISNADNSTLTNLSYTQNYGVSGTGISAKAGLIFRPDAAIRLGAYASTPTWYHLSEGTNSETVQGNTSAGQAVHTPDPLYIDYSQNFNVRTPWKYNFGASFFVNTYGFISADVELVDYRSARFSSGDATYDETINDATRSIYRSAVNYRLGAELRLGALSLRGGYALYGNPYSSSSYPNAEATSITGGIGFRKKNFYIDAAVVNTQNNSVFNAYSSANTSSATALNASRTDAMLTIGTKF